jgi:hypothetical protein
MHYLPDISVIIPCNHGRHDLLQTVRAVCGQTVKPAEIVIVDSSGGSGACPAEITILCASNGIRLTYEQRNRALPGDARNIGVGLANGELIAFIDVQTIPRSGWLEASLMVLGKQGVAGVWGATCFSSENRFERLVRDGFYGVLPRKTLPGSVFRREIFEMTGQFIAWVRAGEDTEWMLRVELLRVPIVNPPDASIDYVGLIGLNIKMLLKKWFRNYAASRDLPQFFPQKLLLWLVLYPLLILTAFNWNYLIAGWRMDSPLYIGHVTKTIGILPGLVYLCVRGLVLPLKRGVGIWRLLPTRFLAIALVCLMADVIRAFVLTLHKRKSNANAPHLGD